MSKLSLTDLVNLQNENSAVTAINNNNSAIETALEKTLSRDGTSPNSMDAVLDMNSNQIINLPTPLTANSPLRLSDLNTFIGGGTISTIPAGGNAAQMLIKASADDYDVEWIDRPREGISQIYTLGDSHTYFGYYQSKLQTLLGSTWNVQNKGVGGEWTYQIIQRYPIQVLEAGDGRAFILLGGTNDLNLYATPGNPAGLDASNVVSTVETNLQSSYTSAKNNGMTVIALTIPPMKPYSTWTSDLQTKLETINTWIKNTATSVDYVIDVYSLLLDPNNAYQMLPAYNQGDDLHFNQAGGNVIGQAIYDAVTFVPMTVTPSVYVTKASTYLNQNLRNTDDVHFQTGRFGLNPPAASALVARSRTTTDDEFQLYLAQANDPSSGWTAWADNSGYLKFCRLATGVLYPATLRLAYDNSGISVLTGKYQVSNDTTPLRVTSATFGGGVGTGVDFFPDSTAGFKMLTYSAGGSYGTQKYDASQHLFQISGTTKVTIGTSGQVTAPRFVSNQLVSAGLPTVDGASSDVAVAGSDSVLLLPNCCALVLIRENLSTGDYCLAMLSVGGAVSILSQTGTRYSNTTTPGAADFGIAYDGTNFKIYNGYASTKNFSAVTFRVT